MLSVNHWELVAKVLLHDNLAATIDVDAGSAGLAVELHALEVVPAAIGLVGADSADASDVVNLVVANQSRKHVLLSINHKYLFEKAIVLWCCFMFCSKKVTFCENCKK